MQQTVSPSDRVRDALTQLCPESAREMFAPMIEMALMQMPAESVLSLATDLESARDENGEYDIDKLIGVGKQFGLTDEMVAGYRQSFAAQMPSADIAKLYATEPPY